MGGETERGPVRIDPPVRGRYGVHLDHGEIDIAATYLRYSAAQLCRVRDAIDTALGERRYSRGQMEAAYDEGWERATWAEDPVNYVGSEPLTCRDFIARLDATETGRE